MTTITKLEMHKPWDVARLRKIACSPRPFLYIFGAAREQYSDALNEWELEARDANTGPNGATYDTHPRVLASADIIMDPAGFDYLKAVGAVGKLATDWVDRGRTAAGIDVVTAHLQVHTDPHLSRVNTLHGTFTLQLPLPVS